MSIVPPRTGTIDITILVKRNTSNHAIVVVRLAFLAVVFEYQLDSFGETLHALVLSLALAISPRDFWAVANEPIAVLLNDRSELIAHGIPSMWLAYGESS